MGAFTGEYKQGENLTGDHAVNKSDTGGEKTGIATDVDGVFADGERGGAPVFTVSQKEFYDNMKMDRKRLRFSNGTPAQQYHSKTRYRRPFWIQNKEDGLLRRIK